MGVCFHSHGLKVFIGQWERSHGEEEEDLPREKGKAWEDLGRLLSVAQQTREGLCLASSER